MKDSFGAPVTTQPPATHPNPPRREITVPHRDAIHIEEEELPGIGMRDDFLTGKGRRVGVITYRDGHRDLLVYKRGDPDSVSETVSLTEGEADILAEYLGTRRVVQRLSRVTESIDSLTSTAIEVDYDAPLEGVTLGEARIREKTGASIVAIWRDKEVTPSPMADFRLEAGDRLVTIGTQESISAARAYINGA